MITQDILNWSAAIIALGGAAAIVWKVVSPAVRKTRALLDSLNRFTNDWFGEEAAPGRDKVPGVMERLNNIDGELKHNGGSTMKDAVKRIESKLKTIEEQLEASSTRLEKLEDKAH